jgi:hypothetical protein
VYNIYPNNNLKHQILMRKFFYFTIFFVAVIITAKSQVTIGSNTPPDANALLDLKQTTTTTKGLLLPRVELQGTNSYAPMSAHVAGMTVYNTATAGTGEYRVSPGFYYNTGTKWERMYLGYTNWFYMPSVSIDVSTVTPTPGPNLILNLYNAYRDQFLAPDVASAGAPTSVPYIPAATDLYYYVTAYDNTVLNITSISATGELSYKVISATAGDCSYINVVFVLK